MTTRTQDEARKLERQTANARAYMMAFAAEYASSSEGRSALARCWWWAALGVREEAGGSAYSVDFFHEMQTEVDEQTVCRRGSAPDESLPSHIHRRTALLKRLR